MSIGVSRALLAVAFLAWLSACESSTKTGFFDRPAGAPEATGSATDKAASDADKPAAATDTAASAGAPSSPETTATAPEAKPEKTSPEAANAAATDVTGGVFAPLPRRPVVEPPPLGPWSANEDPMDQLSLGKRHFREENYGLAEMYFRRVVEHESVPAQRKAEAWIGLAASYDRLKRFELADRAYRAATAIVGTTPEILNNQGYSYLLRGDYVRARAKLTEALEKDPTNPYIQNNIELLEESIRGGGGRKKV